MGGARGLRPFGNGDRCSPSGSLKSFQSRTFRDPNSLKEKKRKREEEEREEGEGRGGGGGGGSHRGRWWLAYRLSGKSSPSGLAFKPRLEG